MKKLAVVLMAVVLVVLVVLAGWWCNDLKKKVCGIYTSFEQTTTDLINQAARIYAVEGTANSAKATAEETKVKLESVETAEKENKALGEANASRLIDHELRFAELEEKMNRINALEAEAVRSASRAVRIENNALLAMARDIRETDPISEIGKLGTEELDVLLNNKKWDIEPEIIEAHKKLPTAKMATAKDLALFGKKAATATADTEAVVALVDGKIDAVVMTVAENKSGLKRAVREDLKKILEEARAKRAK